MIDRVIVWLMLLATIATLTMSSAMLTNWHIHYVTTGGNFYDLREWGDAEWKAARDAIQKVNERDKAARSA